MLPWVAVGVAVVMLVAGVALLLISLNRVIRVEFPGTPTIWEFRTGGPVLSSPAIGSDGTVYVGSRDYRLYAINGKSGSSYGN